MIGAGTAARRLCVLREVALDSEWMAEKFSQGSWCSVVHLAQARADRLQCLRSPDETTTQVRREIIRSWVFAMFGTFISQWALDTLGPEVARRLTEAGVLATHPTVLEIVDAAAESAVTSPRMPLNAERN